MNTRFNPDKFLIDTASADLKPFIGKRQLRFMRDLARGEEGDWFIARMVELAALIAAMPTTGQTDGQGDKAIAHMHYFAGSADFYITEKDSDPDGEGQIQAFGSANLGYGAELGYISIPEITAAGCELDLHFKPCEIGTLAKAKP